MVVEALLLIVLLIVLDQIASEGTMQLFVGSVYKQLVEIIGSLQVFKAENVKKTDAEGDRTSLAGAASITLR